MILRATALVLTALLLAACHGPKPQVLGHRLQPPEVKGHPYTMAVTVKNTSSGSGQISVVARLKKNGATAAVQEQTVQMDSNETVQVELDLNPQVDGPFEQEAEASYPP